MSSARDASSSTTSGLPVPSATALHEADRTWMPLSMYCISFTGFRERAGSSTEDAEEKSTAGSTSGQKKSLHTLEDYKSFAVALGARVNSNVTRKTNVIVAWSGLTRKRLLGDLHNIPVVLPEWLEQEGKLDCSACSVPFLFGYTFCATRFASLEEEQTLATVIRRYGGVFDASLTSRCDALLITPEFVRLLHHAQRRRRRCRAGLTHSVRGIPTEQSGTVDVALEELVSAKLAFAWQHDIAVLDYHRFLLLAKLDESSHSSGKRGTREAPQHSQIREDFDTIISKCAVPPPLSAQLADLPLDQVPPGDDAVSSGSDGSLVEDNSEAEGDEYIMEEIAAGGYPLSTTHPNDAALRPQRDSIITTYGDAGDGWEVPENTVRVTHPDYFNPSMGDHNDSAMVRAAPSQTADPLETSLSLFYDHKRASEAEAGVAQRREKLQKQLGVLVYGSDTTSTTAVMNSIADGDSGGAPLSSQAMTDVQSSSLAVRLGLLPPRVPLALQCPPFLTVALVGCSDAERSEAARVCVLCRFLRLPTPTTLTDVVIVGSAVVRKKRYAKPKAAALSRPHLTLRQRNARGAAQGNLSDSRSTIYYYECAADLLDSLNLAYGIPHRHILPMSWLRECQRLALQVAAAATSPGTTSTLAPRALGPQTSEWGETFVEQTASAPPRDSVFTIAEECVDSDTRGDANKRGGEEVFEPQPPLSVEDLPDVYAKAFRIYPKEVHYTPETVESSTAVIAESSVAANRVAPPSATAKPTSSVAAPPGEDNKSERSRAAPASSAVHTATTHKNSSSKTVSARPPMSTGSVVAALRPQPLTEEEQYQRDRVRAKEMLNGLLRIISAQSACRGEETESSDTNIINHHNNSTHGSTLSLPVGALGTTNGGFPLVFKNCHMCFVEGEFDRPDLAVARGLINLGGGSWLKKTDEEWRRALAKRKRKDAEKQCMVDDAMVEVVRTNSIFGKLSARLPTAQDTLTVGVGDSQVNSTASQSQWMPGEFSCTTVAPALFTDVLQDADQSPELQQHTNRLAVVGQTCSRAPAFYMAPHATQRARATEQKASGKPASEAPSSTRRSPLKYLLTTTTDYLLACLACHTLLNPRTCFLFYTAIPSAPDMLLLQHSRQARQPQDRHEQQQGRGHRGNVPVVASPQPALSAWVWKRRYAKQRSVGVCIAFLWNIPLSHLCRAGGEGKEVARGVAPGCCTADLVPTPQAVALMRVLLFGLRSAVLALNGSMRESYDPAAVTHVVVVDVARIVASTLSTLYERATITHPVAVHNAPMAAAPLCSTLDSDENAIMIPAAVGWSDSATRSESSVLWPAPELRQALRDSEMNDVSVVRSDWLEDCVHWGVFVDEQSPKYVIPMELLHRCSDEASEWEPRQGASPLPRPATATYTGSERSNTRERTAVKSSVVSPFPDNAARQSHRRTPRELHRSITTRIQGLERGESHKRSSSPPTTPQTADTLSPSPVPYTRGNNSPQCNSSRRAKDRDNTPPPPPSHSSTRASNSARHCSSAGGTGAVCAFGASSTATITHTTQRQRRASPVPSPTSAARARSQNTGTLADQQTSERYLKHLTEVFSFSTPGSTPVRPSSSQPQHSLRSCVKERVTVDVNDHTCTPTRGVSRSYHPAMRRMCRQPEAEDISKPIHPVTTLSASDEKRRQHQPYSAVSPAETSASMCTPPRRSSRPQISASVVPASATQHHLSQPQATDEDAQGELRRQLSSRVTLMIGAAASEMDSLHNASMCQHLELQPLPPLSRSCTSGSEPRAPLPGSNASAPLLPVWDPSSRSEPPQTAMEATGDCNLEGGQCGRFSHELLDARDADRAVLVPASFAEEEEEEGDSMPDSCSVEGWKRSRSGDRQYTRESEGLQHSSNDLDGARPRLEVASSVSPLPKQCAVVDVDTEATTASVAIHSVSRHISLARRAGVSPSAGPPSPFKRKNIGVDEKSEDEKGRQRERVLPLRVYILHDLPGRKALVQRCLTAMEHLPPTLMCGDHTDEGLLVETAAEVALTRKRRRGEGENANDGGAAPVSTSDSSAAPHSGRGGAGGGATGHPVIFVSSCEEASVLVTHELTSRESILVAAVSGKWVVQPSLLSSLAEHLERAAVEDTIGTAEWLELHEWGPELLSPQALPLHRDLAKQCRALRLAWTLRRQRVFDEQAFILCFPKCAAAPSSLPQARATSIVPDNGSAGKSPVPVSGRSSATTSDDAYDLRQVLQRHLRKKTLAVQRLIAAGGGTVRAVVLMAVNDTAIGGEEEGVVRDRGLVSVIHPREVGNNEDDTYHHLVVTRDGDLRHLDARLSDKSGSSGGGGAVGDTGRDLFDGTALAEDLTLLLCRSILRPSAHSSGGSGDSSVHSLTGLSILMDASLLDIPCTVSGRRDGKDEEVPLRAWLSDTLLRSRDLSYCLREARLCARARLHQWRGRTPHRQQRSIGSRWHTSELMSASLSVTPPPHSVGGRTSPQPSPAAMGARLRSGLKALRSESTSAEVEAQPPSVLAEVAVISVKCLSWLAHHIACGQTSERVPSMMIGEMALLPLMME